MFVHLYISRQRFQILTSRSRGRHVQPLVFIIKLNIEISNAQMIAKIASGSQQVVINHSRSAAEEISNSRTQMLSLNDTEFTMTEQDCPSQPRDISSATGT
jgi:hypothetical protein